MENSVSYFKEDYIRISNSIKEDMTDFVLYVNETGYFTSDKCPPLKKIRNDSFLFICVLSGQGTVKNNEKKYTVRQGQCIFLNLNEIHSYDPDPDNPWEVMWVNFNGSCAQYYYSCFSQKNAVFLYHSIWKTLK